MSADWPKVRLEDITSILGDGLHGTPKYEEDGEYFFINGNNLSNGRIVFDEKTKRASREEFLKYKKELNERTVLVSINGTLGNVAFYNGEKVFLGKSACYFNIVDDIDKKFVRYVISSKLFQDYIITYATGTTIKNVSLKSMRDFTFRLPPIKEQKRISKVLGDLDDKIALNHQINQTLESMAQAIFKSWFVDFDPVKAKIAALESGEDAEGVTCAAMRAISGKTDDELDKMEGRQPEEYAQLKSTAGLFPSAMQDSELGNVPEGWGVRTIDEVTSIIIDHRGKTPTKLGGAWAPEGIPAISAKNIKAGRIVKRETIKFIDSKLYNNWMKDKLSFGDILLTSEAPLGEMLYLASNVDLCLSQRVFGLRANFNCCFPIYLYFWLNSSVAKEKLHSRTTGSTVGGIRQSELRKVEVLIPPLIIQEKIAKLLENCMIKINQNEDESLTLATIRDTLLPKLLSGELSVDPTEITNKQGAQ